MYGFGQKKLITRHIAPMYKQLPLNIYLNDIATFSNFYIGGNQAIIAYLEESLRFNNQPIIYLWGGEGSGRSHLLQACCHRANELSLTASYLPLAEYNLLQPSILDNLDQCDLVCIDDIESIAGHSVWEEACFNLYNHIQAANKRLIVAASQLPQAINLKLPDLVSRLAWGLVLKLQPLTDEEKIMALQLRAKNRGLDLTDEVSRFLLQRSPRNMQVLFSALEQLDQASLAAQRRLTIPFVKQILKL